MQLIQLDVQGMTCASCVRRLEKKLNALDGVKANVNLALEQASVEVDNDTLGPADLIATVEKAGYSAQVKPDLNTELTATSADWAHSVLEEQPQTLGGTSAATTLWRDYRLITALAIGLAVMVLAMTKQAPLVQVLLTTVSVTWCAWPFHRQALKNLRHFTATMDTLVSMGVSVAYLWSLFSFASGLGHQFFESATMITALVLLGRHFQNRSLKDASAAIRALAKAGAKQARLLELSGDGTVRETLIPVQKLRVNDRFRVLPGEAIPTDGEIVDGNSEVNNALITGESLPVSVTVGDNVIGGSINTSGTLTVKAERVGAETQLAQIAKLVATASATKAPVEKLSDKISGFFVPIVLGLSIITAIIWWALGAPVWQVVANATAVLVIACPCALGLATPTALMVGTGRSAKRGILWRSAEALEGSNHIDTIVFDKTGTLTESELSVQEIRVLNPEQLAALPDPLGKLAPAEAALALAAAVETKSNHPLAHAIVQAAQEKSLPLVTVNADQTIAGAGIVAEFAGLALTVGKPDAKLMLENENAAALTQVALSIADTPVAIFGCRAAVRENAKTVLSALSARGLTPVLATGDNLASARAIAKEVGITEVQAELLPEDKLQLIDSLRSAGHKVAMVGDGINDAAALANADLGIAIGAGTEAARASADVVLLNPGLDGLVEAFDLGRRTFKTIRMNLVWAFAYNVAAIPLAMAGMIHPMIAAGAMAFSSVFVVGNSLRLKA